MVSVLSRSIIHTYYCCTGIKNDNIYTAHAIYYVVWVFIPVFTLTNDMLVTLRETC